MRAGPLARPLAIVVCALAPLSPAQAQNNPADFYRGKSVGVMIGYSVGGGYDVYARMLARHMGKHIPGTPTLLPKNSVGSSQVMNGSLQKVDLSTKAVTSLGKFLAPTPMALLAARMGQVVLKPSCQGRNSHWTNAVCR